MQHRAFSRREFFSTAAQGAPAVGVLAPLVGPGLMAMGKAASKANGADYS